MSQSIQSKLLASLFLLCGVVACNPKTTNSVLLEEILFNSQDSAINRVCSSLARHEIQILYTRINRSEQGLVSFERHSFQENSGQYFYPASTVKLPVAILALEKIRRLQSEGVAMTSETPFDVTHHGKLLNRQDSTHPDRQLTIGHLIKKIFLVSDNMAYNYLFDFVGSDAMNASIHAKGIHDFQLVHKFWDPENTADNFGFVFFGPAGDTLYQQSPIAAKAESTPAGLQGTFKGKGYWADGQIVGQPMDFSKKNYSSLTALQQILERVIFPELFNEQQQFKIDPEDQSFLQYWMSRVPTEVEVPFYDRTDYFDSYGKFLIYGDQKGAMPPEVRIYNKVGLAYGTATDVAYIRDDEGVEFFLTATILSNANQIYNDDQYEYDQVGIPFLAALGRAIYNFEKDRN